MFSIRLSRLEINNFRSFAGQHVFTFDTSGLLLIKGDSGSGKSTILLAISYALGYCLFSYKELKTWGTDDMSVKLTLSSQNQTIVIERGNKLSISVDGEIFSGSAKLVEEKIIDFTHTAPALTKALTYRGQRTFGNFLSMRDAELKEFLTTVLDLGWIEEQIQISQAKINELGKTCQMLGSQLDLLDKEAAELNGTLTSPVEPNLSAIKSELIAYEADYHKSVTYIDHIKAQISEKESYYKDLLEKSLKAGFEVTLAELQSRDKPPTVDLQPLLADKKTAVSRAEAAKQAFRIKYTTLMGKVQSRANIVAQIQQIEFDIQKTLQNECPTCNQVLIGFNEVLNKLQGAAAAARARLEDIDLLATEFESLTLSAKDDFVNEPEVKKWMLLIDNIEQTIKEKEREANLEKEFQWALKTQIEGCKNRYNELLISLNKAENLEIEPLKDLLASAVENKQVCQNKILELNNQINMLQTKFQTSFEEYQKSLRYVQKKRDELEEKRMTHRQFQVELQKEKEVYSFLRGFIDRIFSDILEEIGFESSEICKNIPNISSLSIEFNTEKTTIKGEIKQIITPKIIMNGEEKNLKSGCSGGMISAIELAVDLAVSRTLSRRSGVNLNWLLLDEVFDGLDQNSREGAMEILKRYAQDKLVVVISHNTEFKDLFDKTIAITNNDGYSNFEG